MFPAFRIMRPSRWVRSLGIEVPETIQRILIGSPPHLGMAAACLFGILLLQEPVQLIDDIDSMKHIMFVYAFDRGLMDDENAGLKSYQALWMQIQNEIVGERFNRFTDMVDLDRLAAQEYTEEVIISMSETLAGQQNSTLARPLGRETAREILRQA